MIVWLPEKMNADCSNKLLKILEEPPYGTILLLVTEEPDALLPTLRSRTQRMDVPPVKENAMMIRPENLNFFIPCASFLIMIYSVTQMISLINAFFLFYLVF